MISNIIEKWKNLNPPPSTLREFQIWDAGVEYGQRNEKDKITTEENMTIKEELPLKCHLCGQELNGQDVQKIVAHLEQIESPSGELKNIISYQFKYVHTCKEWRFGEKIL